MWRTNFFAWISNGPPPLSLLCMHPILHVYVHLSVCICFCLFLLSPGHLPAVGHDTDRQTDTDTDTNRHGTHRHRHMHTHRHAHTGTQTQTHTQTHTHTDMHTHRHTDTDIDAQTRTHTGTHTHTHPHTIQGHRANIPRRSDSRADNPLERVLPLKCPGLGGGGANILLAGTWGWLAGTWGWLADGGQQRTQRKRAVLRNSSGKNELWR